MPVDGKQRYVGVFLTVEDALEQFNNAAYYLSRCGRGLMIPLQGPQEMQERYILPADITDPTQYIPAATDATQDLLAWAESTFSASNVLDLQASLPVVVTTKLAKLQATVMAALADIEAMRRMFDPEFLELDQEHQKILEFLGRAKGSDREESVKKHLEDFYTQYPEFRP